MVYSTVALDSALMALQEFQHVSDESREWALGHFLAADNARKTDIVVMEHVAPCAT